MSSNDLHLSPDLFLLVVSFGGLRESGGRREGDQDMTEVFGEILN